MSETAKNTNRLATVSLVITGLLLLTYPLVFVAGIMSLSGYDSDMPIVQSVIAQTFIWLTLSYPLMYIGALILFIRKKSSSHRTWYAYTPAVYLVLCVVFFFAWLSVEEYYYEPYEYSEFSDNPSFTDEELDVWQNSGEVE